MEQLKIEYVDKELLKPYANNAKVHSAEQIEQIKNSIRQFSFNDPIAVWHDNVIIEGHGRLFAVMEMDEIATVPIIRLDGLTDEQRRAYALAHNQLTMSSPFNIDLLNMELNELADFDIDMSEFGFDIDESEFETKQKPNTGEQGSLARDFVIPPFSVFDTRGGAWLERKKKWREIIKDDATSRGNAKLMSGNISSYEGQGGMALNSLLDPVLAEILVSWFMPQNGKNVFDTFAGDTVFGFVAAYKGKHFTGIELREEQARYNQESCAEYELDARYICDDGRNVDKYIGEKTQDLYFSCPPYFDLEVYSDLPNDASNQGTYEEFYAILDTAFRKSIRCLKDNRFAIVVASDMRGKDGGYHDFISDIKHTFTSSGMKLYNEIILINSVGSGAFRARNIMRTRKVVRLHQEVLVFYKGEQGNISKEFGAVEVADIDGENE